MQKQWSWFEDWSFANFPEIISDLDKGCSLEQLVEVENKLDIKLPQSFKEFYLIHNGQKKEGYFGLFYGVSLLSLDRIVEIVQLWSEIIDLEGNEGMKEHNEFQISLVPDKLKAHYANKKWIPFAIISESSYLGLDFDPEPKGKIGQIINFGRDEEVKTVLANSFQEFIDWYIQKLERGNFLIEIVDGFKEFIPKALKLRFFQGGETYLLGEVSNRFIKDDEISELYNH